MIKPPKDWWPDIIVTGTCKHTVGRKMRLCFAITDATLRSDDYITAMKANLEALRLALWRSQQDGHT